MKLIIVESPTKAKTLLKFLGRNYSVKSSYGHIRDLPKKELGVDIENNFTPKYVIPTKSRTKVKQLKDSAQKADLIILATDPDREGEAIAWHIAQFLNLENSKSQITNSKQSAKRKARSTKKYQRITFHEITKRAIEEALNNPGQIDMNLVNSQQARRILDRLVGYKLSPFLWKKVAKGLSAGRVQSVAVRLIVDREREIKVFHPEEYWTIEAKLQKISDSVVIASKQSKRGNLETNYEIASSLPAVAPHNDNEGFTARLIKKDEKTISKLGIKNKKEADEIMKGLKGAEYWIIQLISKEARRHPLPPFTTSTLQQEAAKKFGFSAKQTMRLAQQLYEGLELGSAGSVGLITYHRTDSFNLSDQALKMAREFIKSNFGSKYTPEKTKIYKTRSKTAQEAHEAIRPTQIDNQPEKIKQYLDNKQYKLYDLIWRRFVSSQMNPAILDSTTVDIKAKNYLFRATGSLIKFDGWLKIYPTKLKENLLPSLSVVRLILMFYSYTYSVDNTR